VSVIFKSVLHGNQHDIQPPASQSDIAENICKWHVGLSSSWHLLFFSRFLDAFALDYMDSAQDDFNQREK